MGEKVEVGGRGRRENINIYIAKFVKEEVYFGIWGNSIRQKGLYRSLSVLYCGPTYQGVTVSCKVGGN